MGGINDIQKISELNVNLHRLHIGFTKVSNKLSPLFLGIAIKSNEYLNQLAILDSTLKKINIEIDKCKYARDGLLEEIRNSRNTTNWNIRSIRYKQQ